MLNPGHVQLFFNPTPNIRFDGSIFPPKSQSVLFPESFGRCKLFNCPRPNKIDRIIKTEVHCCFLLSAFFLITPQSYYRLTKSRFKSIFMQEFIAAWDENTNPKNPICRMHRHRKLFLQLLYRYSTNPKRKSIAHREHEWKEDSFFNFSFSSFTLSGRWW